MHLQMNNFSAEESLLSYMTLTDKSKLKTYKCSKQAKEKKPSLPNGFREPRCDRQS